MSSRAAHCCAFCAPRSLLGSIKECLMDCPWYPSENAHTDVSGPIPRPVLHIYAFWNSVRLKLTSGFFAVRPQKPDWWQSRSHAKQAFAYPRRTYCCACCAPPPGRVIRPQELRLSQVSPRERGEAKSEGRAVWMPASLSSCCVAIAVPTGCSESELATHSRGTVSVDDCRGSGRVACLLGIKAGAGVGPLPVGRRACPMVGALCSWAGAGGTHPCAGRPYRQD